MKKSKLWILVIGILVIVGIIGGVLIRFLAFTGGNPEAYYGRAEAEYLLEQLYEDQPVLEIESGDGSGFTVGDARDALSVLLPSELEWKEKLGETEELAFLVKGRTQRVLSQTEFQQFYEYLLGETGSDKVTIRNLMVLELVEEERTIYEEAEAVEEDTEVSTENRSVFTIVTPEGDYSLEVFDSNRQEMIQKQLQATEDQIIRVYTVEDRILDYTGISTESILLSNVWIKEVTDKDLQVFINGYHKSYPCHIEQVEGQSSIASTVADLKVSNQGVTDIIMKSDVITAKVLSVHKDSVEVEGYGNLMLSPHYQIYKIYGELAVEPTSQILVGYSTTNFVVADGVIEAALITEPIRADKIRVVLGTSDYASLLHSVVRITADCPYTLTFQDQTKVFEAGEELELTLTCGYMAGGRVTISPNTENGKLQVLTINRNGAAPSYRGTLEVAPYEDSGLTIVNELSLEEYLYTVVPSEMPTSYGAEALRVQAICARGYAYAMMQNGTYARYGAHLDDSTMTQVYNAVAETEESILSVKDTYGMVPFYDGEVIEAYFFSTSCGTTCNNSDVWDGEPLPYLTDNLENEEGAPVDFTDEAAFRAFIDDGSEYNTLEQDYSLYRWSITYTQDEMSAAINSVLSQRYETNPERILTLQSDGRYASQPITSLGQIQNIEVTARGKSGIVKEIIITGTEATIKMTGQTNARALMTPINVVIKRQDGTESLNWSLLPSPFYYVTKNTAGDFEIVGGGFGHGVGMSQNGTKAMAELGYSAEEIIGHYYTGVEIVNIYQ